MVLNPTAHITSLTSPKILRARGQKTQAAQEDRK